VRNVSRSAFGDEKTTGHRELFRVEFAAERVLSARGLDQGARSRLSAVLLVASDFTNKAHLEKKRRLDAGAA